MFQIVPMSLMLTILITFLVSMNNSRNHDHVPRVAAENMLLSHMSALQALEARGRHAGAVVNDFERVFENIGDWQSEMIVSGGSGVLITTAGPNSRFEERIEAQIPAFISAARLREFGTSGAGPVTTSHDGVRVGELQVALFSFPIDDGVIAIATLVD